MALAEELAPGRSIEEVARRIQDDHPNSDEILTAYQKAMQSARQFVKDKKLVSFPPREELHVVHTPEFRRHEIPFAAYLSPSPKDPNQVGYYYVTPVTSDDLLREHNWVGLENTSVHESYPGHHLQFSVANSIPAASTLPRLMNESSVFYEGWALYCEQLMHEQGFLKTRQHRFVMLKDRLWRALRIIIDVKTQTGKMTYDEAADLMVRELHFPRAQACGDLNWYSQSPAVPMGYALGWSIINRLRAARNHPPRRQVRFMQLSRSPACRRQHFPAPGRTKTLHRLTTCRLNVRREPAATRSESSMFKRFNVKHTRKLGENRPTSLTSNCCRCSNRILKHP